MAQQQNGDLFSASQTERLLARFDQAWRSGPPPRIEEYLPAIAGAGQAVNNVDRRELLAELVAMDLGYRWRQKPAGGSGLLLGDYLQRFPELGPLERLPIDLIGEEYWARWRWGDRPSHDEYARRFPQHVTKLRELLPKLDSQLAAELVKGEHLAPVAKELPSKAVNAEKVQPMASAADLMDTLRQHGLLSMVRLYELSRFVSSAASVPDARALCKHLLKQNWLTPYQVNQLLQGKGRDLVLGPYVLLERLGEGGAGQVFKAQHQKMDRIVALKLIHKDLLTDAEAVGRFYREIQVVSQLDHPNVVHAYDAGPVASRSGEQGAESAAGHFLAMEYVEGMDLAKLVKQGGPLPVAQACEYIRQAALGLEHAHERGLVHRDIKPHNLIMGVRDGLIKVADLGLARLPRTTNSEVTAALTGVKGSGTLTPEKAFMMGTADYLAPEQALDFHGTDIRADIYSLGCTFYYLLTGQPPFPGTTLAEKLVKHQQAEPPALEKYRKDVPAELTVVLRKMLAKAPADRYQTPAEVAAALSRAGGLPSAVARTTFSLRLFPIKLRRPRLKWIAVSLAIGLLVLLPFLIWRSRVLLPPLDRLDGSAIPQARRPSGLPKEVVEVLGEVHAFTNHPQQGPPPVSVALSPDGSMLAASTGYDSTIRLWHIGTTRPETKITGHTGLVYAVAFAPQGRRLASAGADKTVRLWDLPANGPPTERFVGLGHQDAVRALAFSVDGRTLASGSRDGSVRLWDLSGPEPKERLAFQAHRGGPVLGLAFSSDGQRLASGGGDYSVRLWDVTTNPPGKRTLPFGENGDHSNAVAISADGKLLASARDVSVWVVDLGQNVKLPPRPGRPGWQNGGVRAVAFTPDGMTIAGADAEGWVLLWETTSGNKIGDWKLPGGGIYSIAFAADGRHLAVGNFDSTVYILRLAPAGKPGNVPP
jgi:serine/threonine protein kinase